MNQVTNSSDGVPCLSWTSEADQALWEPRLRRISHAWAEIMWLSVALRMRRCCTALIRINDFAVRAGQWVKHGLSVMPLSIESGEEGYANTATRPRVGKPIAIHVGLAMPGDLVEFTHAWTTHNDEEIGRLLGYPQCCCDFFRRVWVERGLVDTTWPMAAGPGLHAEPVASRVEVTGPPQNNVFWRWLGLRMVPHLPCRFDCKPTAELGDRFLQLGREVGYVEEMDWLLEILSRPVEWSAEGGIAKLMTPLVTMFVSAHEAPQRKLSVRWSGDFARSSTKDTPAFHRELEHTIQAHVPRPDWHHADNGFSTLQTMERLHRPLASLALRALAGRRGNVLDLGCGNGALLKKICAGNDDLIPFGIELRRESLVHASELLPQFSGNFSQGDLFDLELWDCHKRYALAILMAGRLLEVPRQRADAFIAGLRRSCDQVLVYIYPDWAAEGLEPLLERVGLHLQEHSDKTVGLLALG